VCFGWGRDVARWAGDGRDGGWSVGAGDCCAFNAQLAKLTCMRVLVVQLALANLASARWTTNTLMQVLQGHKGTL
jgi:hypothetical protein